MPKRIPDDALLADLRRVFYELGHPPVRREYRERGHYSPYTFYERYGGWPDALREAGLDPNEREPMSNQSPRAGRKIPDDKLLSDLRQVADDMGRPPAKQEYDNRGTYSGNTIRRRFDGWVNAVQAAGIDIDEHTP